MLLQPAEQREASSRFALQTLTTLLVDKTALISVRGHKCWVSTRGKCSSSLISLLEWALFSFLNHSVPFWPSFLISPLFQTATLTCLEGIRLCPSHPKQSKQSSFAPYYAEHTWWSPSQGRLFNSMLVGVHIYIGRKTKGKKCPGEASKKQLLE